MGLLVLSRRIGESIVLTTPEGKEVTITVERLTREMASLSFAAPAEVRILRQELIGERKIT